MLTDIDYLAQAIKEKLGIDLTEDTEKLVRKITPRLEALDKSVWEYTQYIKTHTQEWEQIIDAVTINETYFFREEEQLRAYTEKLQTANKPHIRVWSAACSSGEEPYTLAILAKEHLPNGTTVEIIATDLNQDVLAFAKKGRYKKNSLSFRRMDPTKILHYFDEEGDEYVIKPIYKEMVNFSSFNLVEETNWIFMKYFDIIFCRNVLIYFDEDTTKKIFENFYDSLNEKGSLFLGHSDPYRQIYDQFKLVRTPELLYLVKGE